MYTLYGMTGSCSMAVHVLLNEIGAEYHYVDVRVPAGQAKPAEFLKVNPRGSVPVVVEGDLVVREGAAIITYLLDTHKSPLLPQSGKERAKALEWLAFANATMHPAYGRVFFSMGLKSVEGKEEVTTASIAHINKLWGDVDAQLGKTAYVCGEECTAADILLSVIANWGQGGFAKQIVLGDNVKRMLKAVTARPAYQNALTAESVEYKAAA